MRRLVILAVALVPTLAFAGGPEPFEYTPVGDLIPGSGEGAVDDTVYAPGMRFPHEAGPSYANSQVYMHGGYLGPGGGQCDAENYAYPWRDNYCEIRSWDMPLCPAGEGHQGQDVRPATCDNLTHWNVSPSDGTITNVGSYSIYITAADGTRFDLLHGGNNQVSSGQAVTRAQRINQVSNEFGGEVTTIHTHFNIKQDVAGVGFVYVSPYMSLIQAYQELFGLTGGVAGTFDAADCEGVDGWAFDDADPDTAVTVRLSFEGPIEDAAATVVEVLADQHRDDLCDALGSCEHAFSVEAPLSLRDGQPHDVHAYAIGADGTPTEIEASPLSLQCAPPAPPAGVRRLIATPEIVAAWGISPFWDVAPIDDADLDAIDEDREFPSEPVLAVGSADDTVFLIDPGYRREVKSEAVAAAWGLSLDDAEAWPDDVLDEIEPGTPVRDVRFIVQGSDGRLWAIDDPQSAGGGGEGGNDDAGDGAADDGGDDAGGTAGSGGDEEPEASEGGGDGGCGCRTTGQDAGWLWLGLLGLGVAIRRRASRPRARYYPAR